MFISLEARTNNNNNIIRSFQQKNQKINLTYLLNIWPLLKGIGVQLSAESLRKDLFIYLFSIQPATHVSLDTSSITYYVAICIKHDTLNNISILQHELK